MLSSKSHYLKDLHTPERVPSLVNGRYPTDHSEQGKHSEQAEHADIILLSINLHITFENKS